MTEPNGRAEKLRVLIVDDHALFRRGIRELISDQDDMEAIAEAASGTEAVAWVRAEGPEAVDLVLMDIDMPGQSGIETTRQIRALAPSLPIVMFTVSTHEHDVIEAVQAGAIGFLSKSIAPEAIVRALRDFHRDGALPMSRTMATRLIEHFQGVAAKVPAEPEPAPDPGPPIGNEVLTPREQEVLELIGQGVRDREIADRLVVAESTVKKHVQHILRKLNARNRTEAVRRLLGRS